MYKTTAHDHHFVIFTLTTHKFIHLSKSKAHSISVHPAYLCLSLSLSLFHTVSLQTSSLCLPPSSLTLSLHTFCFSFSPCPCAMLGGWVGSGGLEEGVGSSLSQKEMNPINQAPVPVSSLPGPAAYPALCSYVHLHPLSSRKPLMIAMLLFYHINIED